MTRRIASKVELVAFDFDGVLTNNQVLVFEDGKEAVLCTRADGLAFDLFRAVGLPSIIVSTERGPVVAARATKLKVPLLQGVGDKGQALARHCAELSIELGSVVFVGNDINDLSAMRRVGYPIAVADAHPAVKREAWTVLATRGGEGVAREIACDVLALDIEASQPWK